MPPKKVNLGHSLYSSESGGRHRSSGSNASKHLAGRCKGMKCDQAYHPEGSGTVARYTLKQCAHACKVGSNLCGPCEKQYDVPGKWHAKVGNSQLHPSSHARDPRYPMSEWNRATVAKNAKKLAKAAASEGGGGSAAPVRSSRAPTRRNVSQRRASGSPRSNTRRRQANRGASPSPSKQEVTNEALAAYLKSQAK